MPRQTGRISKTERILSVYYLLRHCEEVSMQELRNNLKGWSDKTFSRDIAFLKQAGVPIRFSMKRKAFVLRYNIADVIPALPENKKEQQFIEKLIRLTTIMDDMPDEDCDMWYRETFSKTSKRTMQRDFATLNSIGYEIKYERTEFNSHDAGLDVLPRHYYCDRPNGAYALTTLG